MTVELAVLDLDLDPISVGFDLRAEGLCWKERAGSEPATRGAGKLCNWHQSSVPRYAQNGNRLGVIRLKAEPRTTPHRVSARRHADKEKAKARTKPNQNRPSRISYCGAARSARHAGTLATGGAAIMSLTLVSRDPRSRVAIGGEYDADGVRGFVLLAVSPSPALLTRATARRVARSLVMFAERARVTKSKPARGAYASGRRVKSAGLYNNRGRGRPKRVRPVT